MLLLKKKNSTNQQVVNKLLQIYNDLKYDCKYSGSLFLRNPINLLFSIDQFFFEFSKKFPQRKKFSEFKLQLKERKKLSLFYGFLSKKQVTKIVSQSLSCNGSSQKKILDLLERRLDVILFRSNFAKTIMASRQLIVHKKIVVNNKIMSNIGYLANPGDIISIKSTNKKQISRNLVTFLKTTEFKEQEPCLIKMETFKKWDLVKFCLKKQDIHFLIDLLSQKISQRNAFTLSWNSKTKYNKLTYLATRKYLSRMSKNSNYYRNLVMNLLLGIDVKLFFHKLFLLNLKKYILKKRSKKQINQQLKLVGVKPIQLEISYKLLNFIFLYVPQRIYYPFYINIDLLQASLKS